MIDVRSPGEYNHAHIPGAYSLPLFSNEERAVVGTAYKQESREKAIKHGLDFFGSKMKKMVEELEKINKRSDKQKLNPDKSEGLIPEENSILLYCWRGGMRSGAVAWLFDLYGFKVYTLVGGYKKFRNYVLDSFKKQYKLKLLGGYTGSGKTEVLKELREKGIHIIDLEDLAKHKGSAFGNIGMPPQPTQEMFENILSMELRNQCKHQVSEEFDNSASESMQNTNSPIWLEDESQRIGHVNIPNALWKNMRTAPVCFLKIDFEERLKHIVEEYGNLNKQKMIDGISRIKSRLGGLEAKRAIEFLQIGEISESFRILLKYYDKWYDKGLHNREDLNSLLQVIECTSVTPENAKKLIQRPVYHASP